MLTTTDPSADIESQPPETDAEARADEETEDSLDTSIIGRGFRYRDTDPERSDIGSRFEIARDGDEMESLLWSNYYLVHRFHVLKRDRGDEGDDGLRTGRTLVRRTTARIRKKKLHVRLEDEKYIPGWGSDTDVIEDRSATIDRGEGN